jgi:hypothetical protein
MAPARSPRSTPRLPVLDRQAGDGHGEIESPRSGAAGVEIHDAVVMLDAGPVRMPEHYHVHARRGWVDVELFDVVNGVDPHAIHVEHGGGRQAPAPSLMVGVAPYRGDGSDGRQRMQDVFAADVASVHDMAHTLERAHRLGAEQPVGVGDDSDHGGLSCRVHHRRSTCG